ncbi:hypothetical protein JYG34_12840 [Pseudomonas entomophila]|uniref:hypothetical protein n=1 Tax=Pseudomonas entomophila TaxID=312306 RepID=UPI001BD148B4|nr:hypothetical protein [Pseudomonas entomophila]QVM93836.1 hypothetical protein JYG34_12840 [Pseudomonas entomophila]
MNPIRTALGLLGLSLLSACTLLARPAPEQALIKLYPVPSVHQVSLAAVDGTPVVDAQQVGVMPGPHRLAVQLRQRPPHDRSCMVELHHDRFETHQVYGVFVGDWNGTPTLFLKGDRGELLDSRDVSGCLTSLISGPEVPAS